jgi:cell division septation protein DedD
MKTAFFLVLLTNLTLLMYEYHRGAFDQAAETRVQDAAMLREPILLADEQGKELPLEAQNTVAETVQGPLEAQQPVSAPEAVTPTLQQDIKPVSFACYEAGPFENEQILKIWSQAVIEVQGEVKPVLHNVRDIRDYLVLYPTSGSREDIQAAMQTLRDQGINDAYPLAAGEYKGHISLGAFHRENRAVRMQKDLQSRGIEPVVKPRFKETDQKYALLTGPMAIAGRLAELGKKYPMIQFNALPDNDQNCLKDRSDHPSETATKQPILPETRKAEPGASSDSVASAEIMPLNTDKPALQKTQVQPEPAQKQPKQAIDEKSAGFVCYEAGPFPNESSLNAWQKQIAGFQGTVKPLFRDGKAISDYLVLYPSSDDKDAAKANMQWLHERGINDAWPLLAGDEKGQISLGVFNREVNALQMQKSLLAKGVNSIVKPRYKNKRQKYALISGPESIEASLKGLGNNHPDIKLRRMPDTGQNCSHNAAQP